MKIVKIAFNRSNIANVANALRKLGKTLKAAWQIAWQMAKKKTLSSLVEAIEKYHPTANAVKVAAQIASGSFTFTKVSNGEVRFVENAVVTFVHVGSDFAKFKETLPCGKIQDRTFKISTLNF